MRQAARTTFRRSEALAILSSSSDVVVTRWRRGGRSDPRVDCSAALPRRTQSLKTDRRFSIHITLISGDKEKAVSDSSEQEIKIDYLGCRAHVATYRRGSEMSYIYRRADRALTSI